MTPASKVTSPVTVKLFCMLVGSCNIILFVAESNCKSPAVDSKVFPLSLKLPVSTGEKLVLGTNNALKVQSSADDSVDCIVSFVETT